METTIYGIRLIRQPLPSLIDAVDEQQGRPGTIQFWKSWPDGSRCRMLEVRAIDVPDQRTAAALAVYGGLVRQSIEMAQWFELRLPKGGRYTFDPEKDHWVAPPDVAMIVMRTSESVSARDIKVADVAPKTQH